MTEQEKIDTYLKYLDSILSGDNDIDSVEDEEVAKLLRLAKTMIAADFSTDSKIREELREKLLVQLKRMNKFSSYVSSSDNDELNEDALNNVVAAGIAGQGGRQSNICPYCGSVINNSIEKCPNCNK